MAGYIRQSSFVDGDTITAALFNNEYNQLLNAFNNATGHAHDGTTAEGPVIGLIGDAGETSPNNKVLIDTTNNFVEFYVQVASAPVQQLYIADGAIIPVTDSDIDLGTSSLYFKNAYIDSITTTGNIDVGGNLTVTGTTTFNGGTITMGDAATDNVVFGADINSSIIPNTDDTYDLGSASQEWRNLYIDGTANIDSLVADTADINGGTIDGSIIGGTTAAAITGTAITGTSFVIGSADISEAELETIDGVTAGTVAASKAIVVDANKDITGGRNITITGEIDAATLDISGNADIDGTLEADAITIGGITLAETIADTVGAMVSSNTETGIAVSYDDADNTLDFVIGDDAIVQSMIADDAIDSQHYVDGSIDLVHLSANSVDSDQYVDGSIDLVHMSINSIDSDQYVDGSIDLVHMSANSVDSDQYVDGSIDLIHMSANSVDSDQYVDGSIDTVHLADDAVTGAKLADNIDIAGTLDVTGILTADSNVVVAGNLTVNGTTTTLNTATLDVEDKNITINYGAGDTSASANGAGITIQDAIDASNDATILWDTTNDEFDFSHAINVAGKVTSTGTSVFANLDISGDVDVDGTLEADAITVAGVTLAETISDTVGAMVSSNTESGITVTYDDADNTLDFTVGTLNQNTTGSAATLTTPRAIAVAGDVTGTANFDGSAAISITTTLAADAIVTANITDANVTVAKMAANSVDSDQYVDGSIDTIHIADDAVTGAKIENAVTIATSVTTPLVDAAIVDGENFKINGAQGSDGQVLTSTGSGVAWEAGGGGASAINDLSDAKTFGTSSIMIGDATTGTIDAANYNTGVGVDVFEDLTSGDNNAAFGFFALGNNTSGGNNTMVGAYAGALNIDDSNNTAVGYAVNYPDGGSNNTGIGSVALNANTGDGNTAVGYATLNKNTTGANNVAVGVLALNANTEGDSNVAIGDNVLVACTTGGSNIAIGVHAGDSITTASGNVFIGQNAGQSATTSIYPNIGIGVNAMYSVTDAYQNIAIGYRAGESCTGIGNTFMGDSAGMSATTGNGNVCYGVGAGYNITSGGNNTLIGNNVGSAASPGGSITTASNILVLGDQNITNSHIQVDWTVASDKRDKTDVAPLDMGLSFINKLEPVTYKWDKRSNYVEKGEEFKDLITDGTHKETWTDVGFLAQDVEKLESEFGHNIADETNLTTHLSADKNQYGLTYSKFIPMLVKAVQELSTQVEELKSELLALKGE
jgi:trimeric autotransporter adhesin